jgi:hypothetical protein
MIAAEELSFREWECFEHLARQREGNRISLPKLEQPSSGSKQREENRTLVLHLSLVVWISHSGMKMVGAENLDFVANVGSLLHRAKMSEEAFSVTLWACSAYAAVTPAVGISNRCCPPSVPRSHVLSDLISSPHSPFRA